MRAKSFSLANHLITNELGHLEELEEMHGQYGANASLTRRAENPNRKATKLFAQSDIQLAIYLDS